MRFLFSLVALTSLVAVTVAVALPDDGGDARTSLLN